MAEAGPSHAHSSSSSSDDEHALPGTTARSHAEIRSRRAAIIEGWRTGKAQSKVVEFYNFPKQTVSDVYAKLNAGISPDAVMEAGRKRDKSKSARTPELVAQVERAIAEAPDSSYRQLAAKFNTSKTTIERIVRKNLGCRSYKLRVRQRLTEQNKQDRFQRASALLNVLRGNAEHNMLRFFSDEKIFTVEQAHNHQNDRWIASNPENIPVVERGKFPRSCHVLAVVSSEGDVMPPHFFQPGQGITAEVYRDVLCDVVLPWMTTVAAGRPYVFQQDGAPAHTSNLVQNWLAENVHSFWHKKQWPPNSPDLNPLDYYVWNDIVTRSNQRSHPNVESLKDAIKEAFATMRREELKAACRNFRTRLEAVVNNQGGWFE